MPIKRSNMQDLVSKYDTRNISIAVLCSHSALETAAAAKIAGFYTIGISTKGREKTYVKYNKKLYDEIEYIKEFKNNVTVIDEEIQKRIVEKNGILIPNRSLSAYCGYDFLEEKLLIPMYGGRNVQRTEDRNEKISQYDILTKAGIPFPRRFTTPEDIDALAMVKVQQKRNPLERAFFTVSSSEEYYKKADERIKKGIIDDEGLKKSIIEEFLIGPPVNANYHSFGLHETSIESFPTKIDLVGFGTRRQVNSSGFLQLTAEEQEMVRGKIKITNEEISHQGVTVRESFHEHFYDLGEGYVKAVNSFYPNEMIGMFGLQGAMVTDQNTLRPKFVSFDTSPRIPGDPAIGPTSPLMRNLSIKYKELQEGLRKSTNYKGDRIEDPLDLTMLEIAFAAKEKRLEEIVT